jgi:hypothetical protein
MYMWKRYCGLLASGIEMELQCQFQLVPVSKQAAVPVWHIPVAVCTALNSWWWTERPYETCRVLFKNRINLRIRCIWLDLLYRKEIKCRCYLIYPFISVRIGTAAQPAWPTPSLIQFSTTDQHTWLLSKDLPHFRLSAELWHFFI